MTLSFHTFQHALLPALEKAAFTIHFVEHQQHRQMYLNFVLEHLSQPQLCVGRVQEAAVPQWASNQIAFLLLHSAVTMTIKYQQEKSPFLPIPTAGQGQSFKSFWHTSGISVFIGKIHYICYSFTLDFSCMEVEKSPKGRRKNVPDFQSLLHLLGVEVSDRKIPPAGLYIRSQGLERFYVHDLVIGLPLKNIDYRIQVVNNLAKVTLTQEYINPTSYYVEVEYSFPIEPKAVIHSFRAKFGQTTIVGKVKEKEQARKDYDKGLKEGRQVAYGEVDDLSFDILNLKVGNIPPKTEVVVEIEYVQELDVVMSTFWKLIIVSRVMPRYIMQKDPKRWTEATKQIKSLAKYKTPSYTWNFHLTVETQNPINLAESSTHKLIQIGKSRKRGSSKLEFELDEKEVPEKDFVFVYCTQSIPSYTLGVTDICTSAVISFIPKFATVKPTDAYQMMLKDKPIQTNIEEVKGEYIFVLDRSGSMDGDSIKFAVEALRFFIKSLPSDCYLNIVSFGSTHSFLFKRSRKYTNRLIQQVDKTLQGFGADCGGTEIYTPLYQILHKNPLKNYPRHVFLLTDGGVSNTESVIQLVELHAKTSRVHTIGIGNGVSEVLIKECANKGKGKYVFIKDNKSICGSIIELLESSLTSLITDVELEFDESVVDCIIPNPKNIPYILQNDPLNIYIIFNSKFQKKSSFTLKYTTPNGVSYENTVEIINDPKASFPFIDKMVHHKKITALYEMSQRKQKTSDEILMKTVADLSKEVIRESVKHQVICPLTAFVCVGQKLKDEKYIEYLSSRSKSLSVSETNHQLKKRSGAIGGKTGVGKGGKGVGSVGGVPKPHRFRPGTVALREIRRYTSKKMQKSKKRSISRPYSEQYEQCEMQPSSSKAVSYSKRSVPTLQKKKKLPSQANLPKISEVVNHQNFDGSWTATEGFLKILFSKKQMEQFKALTKKYEPNFVLTTLIVSWLIKHYSKPEYSLITKKASSWLSSRQKGLGVGKADMQEIGKLMIK